MRPLIVRHQRRLRSPHPLCVLMLALWVAVVFAPAFAQEGPDGAEIYQAQCSSCHGASGGGGVGPALAENPALDDTDHVVNQVLHGGNGMPPFADQLSDRQIAAVVTHMRTSWGNDFSPVAASRVEEIREGGGTEPAPDAPVAEPSAEDDAVSEEEAVDEEASAPAAEDGEVSDEAAVDEEATGPAAEDDEESDDAVVDAEATDPSAEDDEEPEADIELVAAGPATLVIEVEPAEAEVEIVGPAGFDSRTLEGTSVTLEDIPAGAYRVTVTLAGDEYVQTVDLTGGGSAEVVFDLGGG